MSWVLEVMGMVTLGGSNWKVARGYFYSGEILFFDLGGGYTDIFIFLKIPSYYTLVIVFCMYVILIKNY